MKTDDVWTVKRAPERRIRVRRPPAAALASVLLLVANGAWALDFTRGPAVRVIPNTRVEVRWIQNFVGHGKVEVFDNPDGIGMPVLSDVSTISDNEHTLDFNVGGVIAPDTTYYVKVTHRDPNGNVPDLTSEPPLQSFFTGVQPPGPEPEQPKLAASDGALGDRFGVALAVSGDVMVVGAPSADSIEDPFELREGAAYVFVKPEGGSATTYALAAKLTASDGAGAASFGASVAIDGDTVVVGALGSPSQSSAAYVFSKPENGWAGELNETARLIASAAAVGFGGSVAIEGDTVVVGAEWDALAQGSAYVFTRPVEGWTGDLNEAAKLIASDGEPSNCCHRGDLFGHSVGVSGDTVVIGAPRGDRTGTFGRGAVYVFVTPGGGWAGTLSETARLTASDGHEGAELGSSVAIRGDTVVVGAAGGGPGGAAYVFVKPEIGWTGDVIEAAKLGASDGDEFDDLGVSAAISGDTVLIGAPGDGDANGAAYVFLEPAGGWAGILEEAAKLTAADGAPFDFLGSSVAIASDTLVVGAEEWDRSYSRGSAYAFSNPAAPADSTAPGITPVVSGTQGWNGWYVGDVAVAWQVGDDESAIGSTSGCDPAVVTSDTPGITFTCSATSAGGTASASVTIRVDETPPVVVCGASDGLWHAADVAIGCAADGGISGLSNPADGAFDLVTNVLAGSEDADAATNSRTVHDHAGNSTVVGPIAGNRVDRKAPDITIDSPPAAVYVLNQAVTSDYSCSDGGSGLASCAGPVPSGQDIGTSVAGAQSFTVNASDQVANAGSATIAYQVQYQPAGAPCHGAPSHQILDPIRTDGTSVFRHKSTVPVKFRVCDAGGASIGTPGVVSDFKLIKIISGTVTSDVNETVPSTTPDTAFRWDSTEQQWILNLGNQNLKANATYVFRIWLNDGTHIDFQYGLK